MIPRVRGNAVQKENGKWSFMLVVGVMGNEDCDEYHFAIEFDTKEEALAELQRAARLICESFEQRITGKLSGKYIDMKTNSTRKWDKTDEH